MKSKKPQLASKQMGQSPDPQVIGRVLWKVSRKILEDYAAKKQDDVLTLPLFMTPKGNTVIQIAAKSEQEFRNKVSLIAERLEATCVLLGLTAWSFGSGTAASKATVGAKPTQSVPSILSVLAIRPDGSSWLMHAQEYKINGRKIVWGKHEQPTTKKDAFELKQVFVPAWGGHPELRKYVNVFKTALTDTAKRFPKVLSSDKEFQGFLNSIDGYVTYDSNVPFVVAGTTGRRLFTDLAKHRDHLRQKVA